MPRLELNDRKFVFFERNESPDVLFLKCEDLSRPVRLCPEQVAKLFISLDTIDEEATTAWIDLSENETHDYSHHLGWGIFFTSTAADGIMIYESGGCRKTVSQVERREQEFDLENASLRN